MKKICVLSFLVFSLAQADSSEPVALGSGLAHAINETIVDKKVYNLFTNILDVFLGKVKFTPEQWGQMYEFLLEGRELLEEKLSSELSELHAAYQREQTELLEAILDPEAGQLDFANAQALIQEAFAELQNDEKFEKIFEFSRKEQNFKAKVATCLLSDLSENFISDAEQQAQVQEQQLDMIMKFLDHAIAMIEHKL